MATLLPILHRVSTSECATCAGMPDSNSITSAASSAMRLSVKNTFIDVSPDGSEEDLASQTLHDHGARTCLARMLSDDSPQQLLARTAGLAVPSAASPMVSTPTPQSRADAAASGLRDPRLLLASSLAAAGPDEGQETPPPPALGAPEAPARKVLVQIPLELASGAPALEALRVDVQEGTVDPATGKVVFSLTVTLSPPRGVAAIASDLKPSVPSAQLQQQGAPGVDAAALPGRRPAVCRHWRSKGWCNYQGSCKFQHPESMRGVDAAVESLPVRGARRRSRDCNPRRASCPAPVGPLQ